VRGKGNTRSAWSGDGSWWAASAVRWRTAERLSHVRGHSSASARGFAHGWLQLVACGACVAAGARGAGSGEELAAVGRAAARRAVRNRLGRYCSTGPGPIQCTVLFCKYSNLASISKYKVKTIPMYKIIETWHGARVDPSKQFLPLGPLPILNRTQVIKFGNTLHFEFVLQFLRGSNLFGKI
jgi:hypothetical protein